MPRKSLSLVKQISLTNDIFIYNLGENMLSKILSCSNPKTLKNIALSIKQKLLFLKLERQILSYLEREYYINYPVKIRNFNANFWENIQASLEKKNISKQLFKTKIALPAFNYFEMRYANEYVQAQFGDKKEKDLRKFIEEVKPFLAWSEQFLKEIERF